MTLEELKRILDERRGELRERFHVKRIGIFGSYARKEQKSVSDVDILVEFSRPVGFFKFIELNDYLEEVLGVKVDLTTENALKPRIRERVMKEVLYV